jgi:hypothetical protein
MTTGSEPPFAACKLITKGILFFPFYTLFDDWCALEETAKLDAVCFLLSVCSFCLARSMKKILPLN